MYDPLNEIQKICNNLIDSHAPVESDYGRGHGQDNGVKAQNGSFRLGKIQSAGGKFFKAQPDLIHVAQIQSTYNNGQQRQFFQSLSQEDGCVQADVAHPHGHYASQFNPDFKQLVRKRTAKLSLKQI